LSACWWKPSGTFANLALGTLLRSSSLRTSHEAENQSNVSPEAVVGNTPQFCLGDLALLSGLETLERLNSRAQRRSAAAKWFGDVHSAGFALLLPSRKPEKAKHRQQYNLMRIIGDVLDFDLADNGLLLSACGHRRSQFAL
jgi:hypothetical protein